MSENLKEVSAFSEIETFVVPCNESTGDVFLSLKTGTPDNTSLTL